MIECERDLLLNLIVLTPKNARREFRQHIFEAWNWECAYCGDKLNDNTATIDHIIPKFRGGHHVRSNMCCCCVSCNLAKGSKLLDDWYTEEYIYFCKKRFVKIKSWIKQNFSTLNVLSEDSLLSHISNEYSIR